MRFLLLVAIVSCLLSISLATEKNVEVEDPENEFAEFEDDEMDTFTEPSKPPQQEKFVVEAPSAPETKAKTNDDFDDDYGVVEDDVEDAKDETIEGEQVKVEPLKFTDVPAHFRSNWASYQVEAVILFIIAVYLVNYVLGRSQNQNIATDWFENNKDMLQEQFALVGDDGVGDSLAGGHLIRETDYSYAVWCTGRVGVRGLLVQLRTVKRQDLLSRVMGIVSPQNDRLTFKFELDAGEMDTFVMAVGQKKATTKQAKEMLDLATFAQERKNVGQFGLPANYALYSESSESTTSVLDATVTNMIRKYEKAVECIHVSDQFSGPKPPDGETYTRMPDVVCLVHVSLNMEECQGKEAQEELLRLVLYLVDKVRRMRLSKEAKAKADKRRREVEEAFMKMTHQVRQEAAQARREEKIRDRKQKLLEEEDPDKQRRLEKLEMKREAKAKQPKMKAMKMKM